MSRFLTLFFLASSFLFADYSNIDEGKKIYESTCAFCHGENGQVPANIALVITPRDLSKTLLNESQSFDIIKYGAHHFGAYADIMPAFGTVYSDDEVQSVVGYIAQTFNPNREMKIKELLSKSQSLTLSENQILTRGKRIFLKTCAKCHGKTGDGQSKYTQILKKTKGVIYPYNLTRTLLDEEQIFLYAKYGGHFWGAYKSDMPAWKSKYNDTELKSVAHYIKTKLNKL